MDKKNYGKKFYLFSIRYRLKAGLPLKGKGIQWTLDFGLISNKQWILFDQKMMCINRAHPKQLRSSG